MPVNLDEDTGQFRDASWTSAPGLDYMLSNKTLELPPAFTHQIVEMTRTRGRQRRFAYCEGFKLYNFFPDNICMIAEGNQIRIVVVSNFASSQQDSDPCKNTSNFDLVEGYSFMSPRAKFTRAGDYSSTEILYYTVTSESLKKEMQTWPIKDLIGKCFIIPNDFVHETVLKSPNLSESRFAFDNCEGLTWDVISLIVPPAAT